MAELHVIGALRVKRAELAGMLRQLEQQLSQQRANLAHVAAKGHPPQATADTQRLVPSG